MPQDANQCKAREGHPSLLFAHKSDIRKLSLDRPSMTAIVNNTRCVDRKHHMCSYYN